MADTIKLSGTYDSIEAYNILTEMQSLETTIEGYKDDAEAAASTASGAVTTAQGYANDASTYAGNASTYATNASNSSDTAAGYAANAYTSETNAAASATAAYNSEVAAALSASSAAASEAVVNGALPLSGGTMTGMINMDSQAINFGAAWNDTARIYKITDVLRLAGGTSTSDGSYIDIGTPAASEHGIVLDAKDNSNETKLIAKPNGTLTWGSNAVIVGTEAEQTFTLTNRLTANASKDFTLSHAPKYWSVQFVSGAGWGSMMVNIAGTNCRITNKNTGTLTEDIKFKVNYIY